MAIKRELKEALGTPAVVVGEQIRKRKFAKKVSLWFGGVGLCTEVECGLEEDMAEHASKGIAFMFVSNTNAQKFLGLNENLEGDGR